MAKTVRLLLNGEPFSLVRESPRAIALRSILDKAPEDELFTRQELEQRHGLKDVKDCAHLVPGYSHKIGQFRYWGNPKAIQALIAQVGQ